MQNENSTSQFEKIRTEKKPFEIQKKSIEYYQPKYLKPNRMSSYGYQLKLAMDTNGSTFLNIGSGNEILSFILKKNNKYIIDLDIDIVNIPFLVPPSSGHFLNIHRCNMIRRQPSKSIMRADSIVFC